MSGFLYFAEGGEKPVKLGDVVQWGLAYAFEGAPASTQLRDRTPTGSPGWLFGDSRRMGAAPFGFDADQQIWKQIPGSGIWLGYHKTQRPSPDSLKRRDQRAGEALRLADGNEWLIPRLRVWDDVTGYRTALPVLADLDADGNWVMGDAIKADSVLDDIAERLYAGMVLAEVEEDSPPDRLTVPQLLDDACVLLGKNYVVSRVEVAALQLLTVDELLGKIARIAMDWERAIEWASKKNEESPSLAVAG